MVEVCVVGGGTSGCEAAAEASARGAEVTVVEREEGADVPWKSWPDLIQGRKHGVKRDGRRPLGSRSPKVLLAEAVRSGPGYVETKAGRVNSDFVVLATGSSFEPPGFQGFRRPGVLTLDSRPSYEELGRTSDSTSRVVVAGEGVRSLEVADRLSAKGLRVKVFVSSWQSRPPSPLVAEVLYDKARRSGVTVVPGSVTRALGEARLEAVLADGTVTPCDTLVFVPRRFPRIVPSQALVGSTGGVLVDQNLRTGDPRTYAAGGCAELAGSSLPCTFVQEPSLSGRVAASNCLGDGIRLVPARSSEAVLFGLRWARCARETVRCGPLGGRKRVGRRWGATSACEIVFEGPGRRVLEVETVEEAARSAGPVPASALTNLSSLAYGRFGSSDISLVSDTARLGLAV